MPTAVRPGRTCRDRFFSLATLVVGVAGGAAATSAPCHGQSADAPAVLQAMQKAALVQKSLHVRIRVRDQPVGGKAVERELTCWIDVAGGRVRTEVRDIGRALPHLVFVAGPKGSRVQRVEVDEVAEVLQPLDRTGTLAAASAGELLITAFRGELGAMKAVSYQKPAVAARGETLNGVACTRIDFGGNRSTSLWVGEADRLPRRLRGEVPGRALDETVVELELGAKLEGVDFDLPLPEGQKPFELAIARERWSKLGDETDRWFRPGDPVPDFAALDLARQTRLLSEFGEEKVVLAFWLTEDADSVTKAAEAERLFAPVQGGSLHFVHVAAGDDKVAVVEARDRHALKQPIWVAGTHAKNAFRRFRIWTGPVFVQLDSLEVVAITRDVAEVGGWFK